MDSSSDYTIALTWWSLVFGKPAVFLDEVLDVKGSDIQHEYNTTRRSNMQ